MSNSYELNYETNTAILTYKVNVKPRSCTLLLELVYVVEIQAPQGLQLTRFLPPTPIRLLLDSKGNDLAQQVAFDHLQRKLKPMDRNMANK